MLVCFVLGFSGIRRDGLRNEGCRVLTKGWSILLDSFLEVFLRGHRLGRRMFGIALESCMRGLADKTGGPEFQHVPVSFKLAALNLDF